MATDFLQRISNGNWLVGVVAEHMRPKDISWVDWNPAFFTSFYEYCQRYKGDIYDVPWEHVEARAKHRIFCWWTKQSCGFLEGI